MQVIVTPTAGAEHQSASVEIYRRVPQPEGPASWVLHAQATAAVDSSPVPSDLPPCEPTAEAAELPVDVFYQQARAAGLDYGPLFRGVEQLWLDVDVAVGRVRLPQGCPSGTKYCFHPVLLDACLQVVGGLLADRGPQGYLPVGIESLTVFSSPTETLWVEAQLRPAERAAAQPRIRRLHLRLDRQAQGRAQRASRHLQPTVLEAGRVPAPQPRRGAAQNAIHVRCPPFGRSFGR